MICPMVTMASWTTGALMFVQSMLAPRKKSDTKTKGRRIPSPWVSHRNCAWLSPERNCSDKFLWLGGKLGEELVEELGEIFCAFSSFICCTEWPTNLLPKFLPIYHSFACAWNFEVSSPRASGVWVSHRKNKKCRNLSHGCMPRGDPSPPLQPVALAFTHVPTDRHPFLSDPRVLRVSYNCMSIACLA